MGCVKQRPCHAVGIATSVLTVILILGGIILIIVFNSDFNKIDTWSTLYSIGIAAISIGSLMTVLTLIYFFIALSHGWSLYGCIAFNTDSKGSNTMPLHFTNANTDGTESGSKYTGSDVTDSRDVNKSPVLANSGYQSNSVYQTNTGYRPTAYDIQEQTHEAGKKETEWDPNTILRDDDMY